MKTVGALVERCDGIPRAIRVLVLVAWATAAWVMAVTPAQDLPELPVGAFLRNASHVAVHAILAALAFLAWSGATRRRLLWSAVLASLFGIVTEIQQGGVPGRSPSVADALSSACGAVLAGCLLAWGVDGDRRAAWAVAAVAVLAFGAVSLATYTGL